MADDDMRTWQVLDAPARIYLQAGELTDDTPFADLFKVTWCQDQVGDHDVEYMRTDLHAAEIERLRAVLEAEKDSHTESLAMYRSARDRAERLQARVRELEAAIIGLHYAEDAYGFESVEWNARYAHAFKLATVGAEKEEGRE